MNRFFKVINTFTTEEGTTYLGYNGLNQLTNVTFEDGSYVSYAYDGMGRKVYREEMSWKEYDGIKKGHEKEQPGNDKDKNSGNNGKAIGKNKEDNKGQQKKQENQAKNENKGNGNGKGKGQGKGQSPFEDCIPTSPGTKEVLNEYRFPYY
ncbi:MAG: RHS repeat protein [Bacillaceae bacterium]|nr:RHS repeat protein [Bacillaceae bacterium]